MAVYLIADIEVIEPDMYREYTEKAFPVVRGHGGRYVVRGGGQIVPLTGGWAPKRILVIEFDTMENLKACFSSPDYLRLAPLREQSTRSRSVIVEGFQSGHERL